MQAVDHYLPAAATFLEQFNFIPRWRIDDLMMSVASDGGGVGPHFDHYDVFLIQTSGERQWEVGGKYHEYAALKENLPVKILSAFKAEESWRVKPGDILYVPPGVGHNGIAVGDNCITCSVGFRAPSHSEILREYTDCLGEQLNEALRYQDPNLTTQSNTGEITQETLDTIQNILRSYIEDKQSISDWFGRYATTPKYTPMDDADTQNQYTMEQLRSHLANRGLVIRNESSRFAYHTQNQQHTLFVDGEIIDCEENTHDLIQTLCSKILISEQDFNVTEDNLNILLMLLQQGALYLRAS